MKIDAIEKYISKYGDDRKEKILEWHEGHLPLMLEAPGSYQNHQAWPCGYYHHILECFHIAHRMYLLFEYRKMPFTLWQVLLVLYFHDVEKLWKYGDGLPEGWDKETYLKNLSENYGFALTLEELHGIKYIHGEGEDYRKTKKIMSRLGAFCHCVDTLSARVWFDKPDPNPHEPNADAEFDDLYEKFQRRLAEDGGVWPEYHGPGR